MTSGANEADEAVGTEESRRVAGAEADRTSDERDGVSVSVRYRHSRLTTPIQAACFWIAIVLPFLYVPLLIAGIGTRSAGLALVALLAINVVTLLAGHSYHSE